MPTHSALINTSIFQPENLWPALRMIGFVLVLHLFPGNAAAELLDGRWEVTGQAFDRLTGELIYTEHHDMTIQDNLPISHTVIYRLPDGIELANKSLDYSKSLYTPDFSLEDLRSRYLEGGQLTEQGYQLIYRKNSDAKTEYKMVQQSGELDLVTDAGIDPFIKDSLEHIKEGKRKKFRLAVAGQLESYTFEVRQVESLDLFGRPAIRIRIQPASLLRLIVAPIDLIYDLETTALLRYEGLSNIRDKDGKRYDTRIDFPPEIQRRISVNE